MQRVWALFLAVGTPQELFSRVGNSFIQVYDQIWITWDWVHVVVVLKSQHRNPVFDHIGDEISKKSEKEHTGLQQGLKLRLAPN
jgi:hypothetical protein